MSGEMMRYADAAMYRSDSMPGKTSKLGHIRPTVTLLSATADPLGNLAAVSAIYAGNVVRSLSEVDDEMRMFFWEDIQKTELQGPLEIINFRFLIEGVTRSWTHQAVRTRAAFIAQESLRFAVVDGEPWAERASMPAAIRDGHRHVQGLWEDAMEEAQESYEALINAGIAAEDARGIMPHDMTTRLHLVVNARTLLHLAGLRLCTQAQFEWRVVFGEMVKAVRQYSNLYMDSEGEQDDHWQFELIADTLRPVCYQRGNCGFMSKFDRACQIRQRVERFAANNIPSSHWDNTEGLADQRATAPGERLIPLLPIHPSEWAADPYAARRNNG